MKSRAFRRTRLAAAVGAALLSLSAGSAFGSAFALQEQNASGLGHATSRRRLVPTAATARRAAPQSA